MRESKKEPRFSIWCTRWAIITFKHLPSDDFTPIVTTKEKIELTGKGIYMSVLDLRTFLSVQVWKQLLLNLHIKEP